MLPKVSKKTAELKCTSGQTAALPGGPTLIIPLTNILSCYSKSGESKKNGTVPYPLKKQKQIHTQNNL